MAVHVLRDCKFYCGAYDLSGSLNRAALNVTVDLKDSTPFNAESVRRTPGLVHGALDFDGYFEAGDGKIDTVLDELVGAAAVPFSVFPHQAAVGSTGFSFDVLIPSLARAGKYGELFALNVRGQSSGPVVRQTLLDIGTKSASGNGAGRPLGPVAEGRRAYAAVHVLSGAGTLGAVLQSSADAAFSSPTPRATLSFVGPGAQLKASATGPVTDTYWRFIWTVSGGPFSVVMGAGFV